MDNVMMEAWEPVSRSCLISSPGSESDGVVQLSDRWPQFGVPDQEA